jgi:FlaA1/EpsC-like NDP-sugar epimerase
VLLDTACVLAGFGLAEITYFRNQALSEYAHRFLGFALIAVAVILLSNHIFGLYSRMWRHAGAQEARQLMYSAAVSVTVLLAFDLPFRIAAMDPVVPLSVVVVGAIFAYLGMGTIRFHSRLFAWQRGSKQMSGLRVAIIGSQDMGAAAIREMQRCPSAGLIPVAVFDDDNRAFGLSLSGVPVVGNIDDIPASVERFTIQQVLLAVANPAPELVEKVLRVCEDAQISMKVLPGVHNLMSMPTHLAMIRQAREPNIEDLLGRTPVPAELDSIRACIAGRRVLVTGAGGSIGSEISRQVASLDPSLLVLLDHDETHLHDAAALVIAETEQALVDINDRSAVFDAFKQYQPEIVLHAAAHKHVPVLEQHPIEAVKTNVFGTLNVVEASVEVGVERFVQISTDKAVRPSSVMGATKRLAEHIVLTSCPPGGAYAAVRFGNVLGSRGSVIPTFARQIANGEAVTVTDPRMTRFFMSVEEAVQLVLQASVLARGGEIFMLDMGQPVRILELAERMIRLSGYRVGVDIPIKVVGRRPGEKLDEELCTPEEEMFSTEHPHIERLKPISPTSDELSVELLQLREAMSARNIDALRELLFEAHQPTHADDIDVDMTLTNGNAIAEPVHNGNGSTNGNGRTNGNGSKPHDRDLGLIPSPVTGGGG